jgi:hypothetical protein
MTSRRLRRKLKNEFQGKSVVYPRHVCQDFQVNGKVATIIFKAANAR